MLKTVFSRKARLLATLAVAGALAAAQGRAQVVPVEPLEPPPVEDSAGLPNDETPQLWFVELAGPPAAEGGTATALQAEKAAFRDNAKQAGLNYSERFAYDTLWNGFSVSIARSDVGRLSRLKGVKGIFAVQTIERPQPGAPVSPDLMTAIKMTGADIAQNTLGLTGKGVKVAIIDTGIDIDHPDLGGNGVNGSTPFPTPRVVAGWDFVGDAYNADPTATTYNPVPVPDPNPDDCAGHGTHVAGIVGANGTVKGVAPEVSFGAYRVFGCAGSSSADIIVAALERALKDGMQVVNMSLGASYQWPQYPTAVASDRLVKKGVVVVASAGNNGANGLYSLGAPGVGKDVIGVASYDNTDIALNYFTATPDAVKSGYTPATGAPLPPTSGTFQLARTGTKTTANDACVALPAGSLAGKVALIRRGACTFYTKAFNAQQAGAVAVVLYNNVTGRVNPTVAGTPPITIPVVAISKAEGDLLDDRLAAGSVDITWTDKVASFPNSTGNLISSFSSYGLSPDLTLKPDLGAPGGFIYSTYPLELGGHASLSGTSMASPHTAGAVALLLQAHPGMAAAAVRGILQNSADPKPWWGNPGLGFLDNVHRQGAGMLDIDDSILATTRIEPSKISLGESQAGPVTTTLTVANGGSQAVTYDLSSVNAFSTGPNTYAPSTNKSDATVTFNVPSVTVPAGGTATVLATVTPATTPNKGQYGGYLVFTPQGGGRVYRVPFAGFIGDYQSIVALVPTSAGLPWLAKLSGGSYVKQPDAGATFTLQNGDVPYIVAHFDHPTRRVEMQIVNAASGKPVHPVFSNVLTIDYFYRNSTSTSFFAFDWDGTRSHDNGKGTLDHRKVVPNGQYKLVLKVLKALGDPENPAHWETWTSPVITLARP